MFGRKTKDKGKTHSYWIWFTVLSAGLAALLVTVWRAMVKRTEPEKSEASPVASKPEAQEKEHPGEGVGSVK